MKKIGDDVQSLSYWENLSDEYAEKIEDAYHQHRLDVIKSMIPKDLYAPNKRIFDFGCGDGVMLPEFVSAGAVPFGYDISAAMIEKAENRLERVGASGIVSVGGAHDMKDIEEESVDAILSFNVLAYLNDDEELEFYRQARRVLKKDGYLIVTHSNELFDMFSLNYYTVNFFKRYLVPNKSIRIEDLLTHSIPPESSTTYNVRENPLSYKYKLEDFGFIELKQYFINLHDIPPPLSNNSVREKDFPDTLHVSDRDRWKLMFLCSTYGSLSVKS